MWTLSDDEETKECYPETSKREELKTNSVNQTSNKVSGSSNLARKHH